MNTVNRSILPLALTEALYSAYMSMLNSTKDVRDYMLNDHQEGYPIYMPTLPDTQMHGEDACKAAIVSITRLHKLDEDVIVHDAGMVCASPDTVEMLEGFNENKLAFKEAVKSIKDFQKKHDLPETRINKLMADEIESQGYRSQELQDTLNKMGAGGIDLKSAYSLIRVFEPGLSAFGWTWRINQSRMKRMAVEDAIQKANDSYEGKTLDVILDLLSQCNQGETLLEIKRQANQLRANYSYPYINEDGKKRSKQQSCNISKVVVVNQKHLPRIKWRPDPGDEGGKQVPRESNIEDQAFIEAMNLYRYK